MPLIRWLCLSLFLVPVAIAFAQTPPCAPLGQNLILNPGFEQGYYAFTSDFGRGLNNATRCNCNTQGWILVAQIYPHISPACQIYPPNLSAIYGPPNTETSLNSNDPSNTSVATLAICNEPLPDHTSGSGFFLTVDPDACEGRSYWKQTLQVCPNTNYYFSVWVRNIGGLPAPTFHFAIDNHPVTAPTTYPDGFWVQTSVIWNSGNLDGIATLELRNDLPGCDANDVAIDDLFLGVCGGVELSSDNLFRYCPDDASASFNLSGHAIGFMQPDYQWQHLASTGGSWTNLAGETDTVLTITAPSAGDAGWFRLLAAEQGNIESITCAVVSPLIHLNPFPTYHVVDTVQICVGQTYAGYAESGVYADQYQTIMGCDSIRALDLRIRGDVQIYIPNIFSPNDDGVNDQIQAFCSDLDMDFFHWQIFDRWGDLVFETYNPVASWDGNTRGKPSAAGIYVYTLTMEIRDCQRTMLKGDLLLLR